MSKIMSYAGRAVKLASALMLFYGCNTAKIDESKIMRSSSDAVHWTGRGDHRFLWDINNDGKIDLVTHEVRGDNFSGGDQIVLGVDTGRIGTNSNYWCAGYAKFYPTFHKRNLDSMQVYLLTGIAEHQRKADSLTDKLVSYERSKGKR